MNIAIDIDDTLTNSFDYFMPFVAEFFNVPLKTLQEKNISYSNFPKEWKSKELEFCKKYYDKTVVGTTFKPDSVSYVKKLHELGHKIIIITGRDNTMYSDAYKTTKQELDKNNLYYDEIICSTDKAKFCQDKHIDLFIDDMLHNLDAVSKVGVKCLLFTSKQNKNIKTDFERVNCWEEVLKKVEKLTND